ncbi:hypothetical protein ACIA49_20500 [Kribbella sp. NPDC051587]|uniref:hypothetical protein n=1 Tax=Kribbella sp. NPDC051587 TaxID=3364119 RepID=UPI003799BC2A
MPKLTDDQLGDLLRETFTDHEADVLLPKATKRRPLVPVLVAAAAVLAVLGGTLYTVHGNDPVAPVDQPPTASAGLPVSSDAAAWAKAIRAIAQDHAPAGGWKLLEIHKSWGETVSTGVRVPLGKRPPVPTPGHIPQLGPAEQEAISRSLQDVATVTWKEGLQNLSGVFDSNSAQIVIHPVTRALAHRMVEVSLLHAVYDGTRWNVTTYTEKVVVS